LIVVCRASKNARRKTRFSYEYELYSGNRRKPKNDGYEGSG
jgi:hypothetical protein